MRLRLLPFAVVTILVSSCASQAQTTSVEVVAAFPDLSFEQPTEIQNAGDGSNRLFVCEKFGRIKVFPNREDVQSFSLFLDLSNRVVTRSEMGLLGLAFHPDYASNGYFYVNYNISRNDSNFTVISRFSRNEEDANQADLSSEVVLMEFYQPFQNHDGGQLAFGPDGYLYIGTGDGGAGGDPLNSGQRLNSMLGKILRIDVDNQEQGRNYAIPVDNPFVDDQESLDEIYAYGLRNPWRFSFDPETGLLWAADVGQDRYEEIDIIEKGKNYGWNTMEGWHCFVAPDDCDSTGMTGPIWEYGRSGGASITGGYVYRGDDVPELLGKYVYADFVSGKIWALSYDGTRATDNTLIIDTDEFISTFGVDESGELYFGSFGGGLYRFAVPSSVGNQEKSVSGVSFEPIRPNPAADHVNLAYRLSERSAVRLTVHDVRGEELLLISDDVRMPGMYSEELETGQLPESVYYIRLTTDQGTISQTMRVVR